MGFVQQVFTDGDTSARPDVEESGEIIFKNDRQLKWTYLVPDYKVFLLQGDDYKFYDEDNEQLIVGKVKDKSRQWIWQLLFSDDIFQYARWDGPHKKIHIENKSETMALDIEITINSDFLPVKVSQVDITAARVVYYFQSYQPKIKIAEDTFLLSLPEDVAVVRADDR